MKSIKFFGILNFLLFACEVEDTPIEPGHGIPVIYESSPSLIVCGGTHDWVDNFIPFLVNELQLGEVSTLHYRWVESTELPCRIGIPGCATPDGIAWSQEPFLLHELVHSTLITLGYPSQPFFGEGIAVAFDPLSGDGLGPTTLHAPPGQRLSDPRPLMALNTMDLKLGYAVAGAFVSFLLARHGPSKFLDFLRELDGTRDLDVIRRTFSRIYDLDLDAESELFMVGAPCKDSQHSPLMYDCTAPEVPWDGDRWRLEGTMDCASDSVVGGINTATGMGYTSLRSVTFDVPTTGMYQVHLESTDNIRLQIGPCATCPWRRDDHALAKSAPLNLAAQFEAGPHFIRILADSDTTSSFTLTISPTSLD